MKQLTLLIFICLTLAICAYAIPSLPAARCAGGVVVYNNSIYYIGGSNNWSGTICYQTVFHYNGSAWITDSTQVPDANTWGANAVIVSDTVYYVSGWPSAPGSIRYYVIASNSWNSSTLPSCSNSQSWGVTSQYYNRMVYLFTGNGSVYKYSIDSNQWSNGTIRNGEPSGGYLASVIYNNEIYVLGYGDNVFAKYNPTLDSWTTLATPLNDTVSVALQAGCMAVLGGNIYVAASVVDGSTSGFTTNNLIYSYDILNDSWHLDSAVISSGRAWSATAVYQGGFYILGGLEDGSTAIDSIEQVVPLGFTGVQEKPRFSLPSSFAVSAYPNPFNPTTQIKINAVGAVRLTIYNQLGETVAHRYFSQHNSGQLEWSWNAAALPSGMYFLRASTQQGVMTKSLLLLK